MSAAQKQPGARSPRLEMKADVGERRLLRYKALTRFCAHRIMGVPEAYWAVALATSALEGNRNFSYGTALICAEVTMRRVFGVGVVLLLMLGLPGTLFGQRSPSRDRGSQLNQNYPNPFNPTTTIPFTIWEEDLEGGRPAVVTLRIYNVLQQLVAIPKALNHSMGDISVEGLEYDSPGLKEAFWDGTDRNGRKVASGIYYLQLVVNGERRGFKKMVVTK